MGLEGRIILVANWAEGFRSRHSLCLPCLSAMAPHLSPEELDLVAGYVAKRLTAKEIWTQLKLHRDSASIDMPKIWAVRRAMAGVTHKRGRSETRGRKKKLTEAQVTRLVDKRRQLVQKVKGGRYVSTTEVVMKSRVPAVHRTTALRYLRERGIAWRRMREKPPRTIAHEEDRKEVCRIWRKRPATFWTEHVDLIIDAKKFPVPGSAAAAHRLRQQKVRGVLRTRKEGVEKGFTRPSITKHKFNAGGHVHILAGICGDKVVLWEEIGGKWGGQRAADMYAGPIKQVLQRRRPGKRSWLIMEDNDPAGFKSTKGKEAKKDNKMRTLDQPAYSPNLNPLDFSIWSAIEKEALARRTPRETMTQYKTRLRKIALGFARDTSGRPCRAFAFVHRRYSRLTAKTSSGTEYHSPTTGAGECQACVDCSRKKHVWGLEVLP